MSRPTGWDVLDLDTDPTPGDLWTVADLRSRWADIASDAALAETGVRALSGDGVVQEWIGRSGDVFRQAVEDFAVPLGRCRASYDAGAQALSSWRASLAEVQAQADRALVDGKAARQRLDAARTDLAAATAAVAGAASVQHALDSRPAATPPDPAEVRAAVNAASAAAAHRSRASAAVSDASAALDAAKALARDARDVRERAGRAVARSIDEAARLSSPATSFWRSLKDAATTGWHVLVVVAKVTVAVLGIVALVVGGPIAWVVLAAALVVLADTLWRYHEGRASGTDVAWALVDCLPGTRGLTTAAKLRKAVGGLGDLGAVLGAGKTLLRDAAGLVRRGGTGVRRVLGAFLARRPHGDGADFVPGEAVDGVYDFGHVRTHLDPRIAQDEWESFVALLRAADKAGPVIDHLRATGGKLPEFFVDKEAMWLLGWRPTKSVEHFRPGGLIGGDVFENLRGLLPSLPGRKWFEADLENLRTGKRGGERLLWSNDGLLWVTADHYDSVLRLGTWK